jgi:hypothetical protein
VAWTTATAYVVLLGLLMRRRFAAGGWKALRVIEAAGPRPAHPGDREGEATTV